MGSMADQRRVHQVPGKPGEFADQDGHPVPVVEVFPFLHHADLGDLPEGDVMLIRKMPKPLNMTVHVANEHTIDPKAIGGDLHRLAWVHMNAHVHGRFREGAEHWHDTEVSR